MSQTLRSDGAKHAVENLDMFLSKLDSQSECGLSHTKPTELAANPGYTLQKLPPYPPAYLTYPASCTNSSSRSLFSAADHRTKTCGTTSCACRIAVIIIVVLLVIWGITVPLYFFVGPGKAELQQTFKEEVLVQQIPEAQISEEIISNPIKEEKALNRLPAANNSVFNAANCSFRIVNHPFTRELQDSSSMQHQTLKLKVETLLTIVFQREKSFAKAVVTKFWFGTAVQFIVMLSEERSDVTDYIYNVISRYLLDHWMMLGVFQIDLSTLTVHHIRDLCASNNGGCSHHCHWSLLRTQSSCDCPHDYFLGNDFKTCQHIGSIVTEEHPTRKNNPCSSEQFLCSSNQNCIPKAWVCDGVSDCLHEEDEHLPNCGPDYITNTEIEYLHDSSEDNPAPYLQDKQSTDTDQDGRNYDENMSVKIVNYDNEK